MNFQTVPLPNAGFAPLDPIEAELRDFSYIVSHDLAASVRYAAEFSNMLLADLGDKATPTQRIYTHHLARETQRCREMLDQLLIFSRTQHRDLVLTPCNVTHIAEMALLQLSAEMNATEATVALEPLGELSVDMDLMTTVFHHALHNALTFRRTDKPPTIELRCASTPVSWAVRIIDDGIGAAVERQEKLFRMFYRDHAEGVYPGTGAGLAIARRIVRRHGGDMRFIAGVGSTCLEISLPAPSAEHVS